MFTGVILGYCMNNMEIRTRNLFLFFILIFLGFFPQVGQMSQVRVKAITFETMVKVSDVIVAAKFLGSDKDANHFDRFQITAITKQASSALESGNPIIVRSAGYCSGVMAHTVYSTTGVMRSRIIDSFDANKHKNLVIGKIVTLYLKNSCSKDDWEYTAVGSFIE